MSTLTENTHIAPVSTKKLRSWRLGLTGWILALALVFVSKSAFSQDKKDKLDPKKSLHEVAVKLYEHTATEAEYLFLQNLYRSTSNASNKRYVLSLAAQYQRQVLKNPVKTLELVLPQLIAG